MFLGNKKPRLYIGSNPVKKAYLNNQVVYASEEYPFASGQLAAGLTLSGFSISDNTLNYNISQSGNSEADNNPLQGTAMVIGIDLTGFDYLEITATASSNSYWGTSTYCKYGIETADNTLFEYAGYKDPDSAPVDYTVTLDVSQLDGVHNLMFECQVHAQTGHEGYVSAMKLNISKIKLHNEEV